jgi:hypothetical protein
LTCRESQSGFIWPKTTVDLLSIGVEVFTHSLSIEIIPGLIEVASSGKAAAYNFRIVAVELAR